MLGLLVVDHGSKRERSNRQLETIADELRVLRPHDRVAHAHMELAPPAIAEAFDALVAEGVDEVVVLLYFLSDGRHVDSDIPALVGAAAARHPGTPWRIAGALGPHRLLAELLLLRAGLDEAGA